MKILMFGWEFPPMNRGGLGTACQGLTNALMRQGNSITLVLPRGISTMSKAMHIIVTEGLNLTNTLSIKAVDSPLYPYITASSYSEELISLLQSGDSPGDIYGKDLFQEVARYAEKSKVIASFEKFDIIHAHDWMTFEAGIKAKAISGKPLVVHVHATDFDRTGGHPNKRVYERERKGMEMADMVIAVSNYTKNIILHHYGMPADKVRVVHNGIELGDAASTPEIQKKDKIVLFLGRLTLQKGPDYFLAAAQKVLSIQPDAKFVVAGTGDMYARMIETAAAMGIGHKVLFTGHLSGHEVDKAYQMASLYVMPSVSEPFGITPLEALKNNTPVLISKQSGVSEVLQHALKVDFWDVDEIANKILSVLHYRHLRTELRKMGREEINSHTWDQAAKTCLEIYESV